MAALPRLRVVVADDSSFMRRLLSDALGDAGFDVVASVEDGDAALRACTAFKPNVLSLDLAMPGLDGLGVLKQMRAQGIAIPVVVVSAFSPAHGARAVDALSEGAVDLVPKPGAGGDLQGFLVELVEKIRAAATSRPRLPIAAPTRRTPSSPVRALRANGAKKRAVVIACSTGGPRALAELMPRLPARLGVGTLIVQHMPAGFTGSLAQRLDRASTLNIREAVAGDRMEPGSVLVAPGGRHLHLKADRTTTLGDELPIGGLRPRADLTIADAAEIFGRDLVLVVLTGMGKDGLEGAQEVRRRGGTILAEAEASCTVYGMPRAIVEAGLADGVHELADMPAAIAAVAG